MAAPTAYPIALALDFARAAIPTPDAWTRKQPRAVRGAPWLVRVALFDGQALRDVSDLTAINLFRAPDVVAAGTSLADAPYGTFLAGSTLNAGLTLAQWQQSAPAGHATFALAAATTTAFPLAPVRFNVVGVRADGQTVFLGYAEVAPTVAEGCGDAGRAISGGVPLNPQYVNSQQLSQATSGYATPQDLAGFRSTIAAQADALPVPNIYVPSYANELWLAPDRNDGKAGRGRSHDPFDASSQAKFDAIMSSLPQNCAVHFLPGVFKTLGYPRAWVVPANANHRYVGAGKFLTTIRLVGTTPGLGAQTIGGGGNAAILEVHDLTADGGLDALGGNFGACNVAGVSLAARRGHVRNVRVINWGAAAGGGEGFPLSLANYGDAPQPTEDDPSELNIESCRVEPALMFTYCSTIGLISNYSTGKLLHNTVIGNGSSDCAYNVAGDLRGLIMIGNHASNVGQGFHQDTPQYVNGVPGHSSGFILANNVFEGVVREGMLINNVHSASITNTRITAHPGTYIRAIVLNGDVKNCVFAGGIIDVGDAVDGLLISSNDPASLGANTGNTFRDIHFSKWYAPASRYFLSNVSNTANLLIGNRDLDGQPLQYLPDSPVTVTSGPAATKIEIPHTDPNAAVTRRWTVAVSGESLLFQLLDGSGAYLANFFLDKDGTVRSDSIDLLFGTYGSPIGGMNIRQARLVAASLPAAVDGLMAFNGSHFYGAIGGVWKQLDN